jgi:hypothetical protein
MGDPEKSEREKYLCLKKTEKVKNGKKRNLLLLS